MSNVAWACVAIMVVAFLAGTLAVNVATEGQISSRMNACAAAHGMWVPGFMGANSTGHCDFPPTPDPTLSSD